METPECEELWCNSIKQVPRETHTECVGFYYSNMWQSRMVIQHQTKSNLLRSYFRIELILNKIYITPSQFAQYPHEMSFCIRKCILAVHG